MANFRLLHITDLHISIPPDEGAIGELALWMALQFLYPSRARKPVLQAVAALAFHLRNTVDTFVLSGDFADDGERRNLEAALSFVDEPASHIDSYLTDDEFPTLFDPNRREYSVFVTPGNHDRFRSATRRLPGGTEFDNIFQSYWSNGLGGVQALTIAKSTGRLSLLSADLCLRQISHAPLNVWGQGMAYENTLEALKNLTSDVAAQYPDSGRLWILHFPPLLDVEPALALRSASDVLDAAKSVGIKYIIAGHLHRNQQNNYDGVEVICTGTASSDLRAYYGNSIRLFDIEVSGGDLSLSQTLYRYRPSEASFIAG